MSAAAVAQGNPGSQTIERVANRSLKGAAYARLRGLSWGQCEARCLADARCLGFEHFRGGGVIRRVANCALFSVIESSNESRYSDVGYKRRSVASKKGAAGSASAFDQRQKADRDQRIAREVQAAEERARSAVEGRRRALAENQRAEKSPTQRSLAPPSVPPPVGSSRGIAPPDPPLSSPQVETKSRGFTTSQPRAVTRGVAPDTGAATGGGGGGGGGGGSGGANDAAATAAPPASAAARPFPTVPTLPVAPPAPVGAAPAPAAGYHIVPVFFGTDRNRKDLPKRIAYANDRARRLELGQALVTVPLEHKVPNIERPRAWSIPYFGTVWQETEDPKKHFTIREIKTLNKTDLLTLVRQRLGGSQTFKDQSIVFIHGYNVGFDDALFRTAQISYDLQFDGATFAYSWPSGSGWTSYPYDRDSAQQAEPYLFEFLQMVLNETGTKSINIIAHSMGNQLLLQVLRELKRRSPGESKINQIVLAAPDVDRDAFEFLASEIRGLAKGITLYAAGNDNALQASRIFAGNRPRAGDVPPPPLGPVVVADIDTIDITSVSTGYLSLNHSGYAENSALLSDIKRLFRTGLRPPDQRVPNYRSVTLAGGGTYWRYDN